MDELYFKKKGFIPIKELTLEDIKRLAEKYVCKHIYIEIIEPITSNKIICSSGLYEIQTIRCELDSQILAIKDTENYFIIDNYIGKEIKAYEVIKTNFKIGNKVIFKNKKDMEGKEYFTIKDFSIHPLTDSICYYIDDSNNYWYSTDFELYKFNLFDKVITTLYKEEEKAKFKTITSIEQDNPSSEIYYRLNDNPNKWYNQEIELYVEEEEAPREKPKKVCVASKCTLLDTRDLEIKRLKEEIIKKDEEIEHLYSNIDNMKQNIAVLIKNAEDIIE